jgi:hypothetical protein
MQFWLVGLPEKNPACHALPGNRCMKLKGAGYPSLSRTGLHGLRVKTNEPACVMCICIRRLAPPYIFHFTALHLPPPTTARPVSLLCLLPLYGRVPELDTRTMAATVSIRSRCWLLLAACVFCGLVSCCKSAGSVFHSRIHTVIFLPQRANMHEQRNSSWSRADEAAAAFHAQKKDAVDVVGRALFCFNDRYVSALRACSLGSDGA